ncbi:MAG: carbon-nitrogen hydrolase family protein [Deltaproteobacteria bacterium]|nr:carbon-nitrogen hydrolase family protein [Deltaproteobacteria bacterium]
MFEQKFKAAAVLASSSMDGKAETMNKVLELTRQAAEMGASLIVFPETFVPYYPWWIWMAVNNPQRLELYHELYENSIEVPGPEIHLLAEEAARLKVHVTLGLNEKDGGTIYNSQVLIDDQGRLIGKRRKLMPTGEERTVWGWGHGNDLAVYDTDLGKIGALICYEHSMALSRFALYSMGEQIHVANWPGANFKSQPRDRSRIIDAAMRHTAFEGQVFVVFSSSRLSEEDVAYYHELDPSTKDSLVPGGGIAGIVDPLGNYLAGPVEHEESVLVAEIDLDLIESAKHMVDSVGHYNRPDIFALRVDRRPRPAIITLEDSVGSEGQKPVEMAPAPPEAV